MDAVEPLICTTGHAHRYRVLPTERCSPLEDSVEIATNRTVHAARNDADHGLITLDQRLRVHVKERVFPGDSSVAVVEKWIYILRDGVYRAEIFAVDGDEWQVLMMPSIATPNDQRTVSTSCASYIDLDPGPKGAPYKYHFYISPIRLTPKALKFLKANLDQACVERQFKWTANALVEVPDAFYWAADAHNRYFIPKLTAYEQFMSDPENQARLFIAGVLDTLLKDHNADIEDKLIKGQPKDWLHQYNEKELTLRTEAEQAGAYLAQCVDSAEHFAVEMAGMESGEEDLAICYVQWAVISEGLSNVVSGREFVFNVVSNADRLPAQFLFASSAPAKQLHFEDYRYGWLSALAAFENLVPEKFREFRIKKIPALTKIKDYLKALDLQTKPVKLAGKQKRIAKNVITGKPLQTGFGASTGARKRFHEHYEGLLIDAEKSALEHADQQAGKWSKRMDKVHAAYQGVGFGLKMVLGTVIEIINVSNALNEYLEAKGDDKGFHLTGTSKARNLAGACADISAHVISLTQEALEHEIGHVAFRSLTGAGGIAMFVSGTCDMLTFEEGMVADGLAKNDYAVETGKLLSASGSFGIAVCGALTLTSAIWPAAAPTFVVGGPAGMIAAIICGILVIGGCLIAAWLKDNYYQQFAGACCFGQDHGKGPWYFDWAVSAMGSGGPLNEAKNLVHLLAAFGVRGGQYGVGISLGYITDDCILEFKARNRWYGIGQGRPLIYSIRVELDTDEFIVDGPYPLPLERCAVRRDDDGNVTGIQLCTDEVFEAPKWQLGKGSWMEMSVWVRMRSRNWQLRHPASGGWVKVDALYDSHVHTSFDPSLLDENEDPTAAKSE